MALHAVAMVVMLYAIAPLVYPESRYPWFYKTVGVVQYVNAHGQLNRSIDIYQNWPASLRRPLGSTKWRASEPLGVCEVGPTRVRTSGSPVAVRDLRLFGTHRSAKVDGHPSVRLMQMDRGGLFATGDRHLTVIRGIGTRLPVAPYRPHPTSSQARSTHRFLDIASTSLGDLKGLYSRNCRGLCCTHPDLLRSHIHPRVVPLIVVMQLGALAVAGLMRPRWLPLVLAAIAIGYLLPRLSFVDTKYGLLDSFGAFFSNAAPPSVNGGLGATSAELLIERSAELLSAFIWGLALLGIWVRRREGRPVLALAILAFSPALVLLLGAYGNEGSQPALSLLSRGAPLSLRVCLFRRVSAPESLALRRSPRPPRDFRLLHMHAEEVSSANAKRYVSKRRPVPGMARSGVGAVVASALFFPAFYDDAMYDDPIGSLNGHVVPSNCHSWPRICRSRFLAIRRHRPLQPFSNATCVWPGRRHSGKSCSRPPLQTPSLTLRLVTPVATNPRMSSSRPACCLISRRIA